MYDGEPAALPLVLMYHSVARCDVDPFRVTVSPSRFADHMRLLQSLGVVGSSMADLLRARDERRPGHRVGLTFDDGYQDFVSDVLPVLHRYGFTATVFVVAGSLGGDNHWDGGVPRKALLTADQLRLVDAAGMEVGSHGLRHVSLSSVDDAALRDEVDRSRAILRETTGQEVDGFCYPYGDLGEREIEAVRAAGYRYGCAVSVSELTGRYALPRTYVGDRDGAARLFGKWLRHRLAQRWLAQHRPARVEAR
jgi:peptidoglycan/xylan/chitin deacetylase (PgdA/CDA1 family)